MEKDGDLNETCFQLACQNQDLAIMKLLVQKASCNEKSKTDVEMSPLNELEWKEWLFGNRNKFLTQIIAQETEIAAYLKRIYRHEYGIDYQIQSNIDSSTQGKSSDKLQDAKDLYELQMQEGNLNLNMEMNASLTLLTNIEFLNLNNRKHFEIFENMENSLLNLTEHDSEDKSVLMLDSHMALIKSKEDFPRRLFQSSVDFSNRTLILHLVEQFPKLVKDKELFSNCEASQIFRALVTYPEKFQSKYLMKYVKMAFIHTVKSSDTLMSEFLLNKFPRLIIDDSLFEVDSSLPFVSTVLKAYPEMIGGQAIEDLCQIFNDSNLDLIASYINRFPCLSQNSIPEGMCEYAFANSNVRTIYQIIDKNPRLKNSENHLIKFLSYTDLRSSNIKAKDINIKLDDDFKSSPLHLAAKEGSPELVKFLLSKGADIEAKDDRQRTPLHEASWNGHEQITILLIQNIANVDAKNGYGQTPLHLAALDGREKIAEILLQNHANPNARNENQDTPLHTAAAWGNSEVMKILLNHRADKHLKNKDNRTPLEVAQHSPIGYYNAVVALLEEQN